MTLGNAMRAGLSLIQKITYAMQLTAAIEYLSSQNPPVVHRDIKPANIFIKGDSCVLGDFGLMKRLDQTGEEDKSIIKESIGVGMPFHYRTPDLVDYLLGKAVLSAKTDVFQLGLVLAHLFTGRNPLIANSDFTAPVELEQLGLIPGELGSSIAGLIKRMLIIDSDKRPPVSELQDPWQGVFRDSVELAWRLEGRVF
jgi:serine/threonine protein kinase